MNDFISYLLPDYSALIDDKIYAIETIYAGALDDDEDVLPFVLCRKNSELKLELEGVCFKTLTEEVEYFKSYETFRSRYFFLIAEIENNFA